MVLLQVGLVYRSEITRRDQLSEAYHLGSTFDLLYSTDHDLWLASTFLDVLQLIVTDFASGYGASRNPCYSQLSPN